MGENTVELSAEVQAAIQRCVQTSVQLALETSIKQTVKTAVHEALHEFRERVESLEYTVNTLQEENCELKSKLETISTATAIKQIDSDLYSRKWNLIIHGIKGEKGEKEDKTEEQIRAMAVDRLKIPEAANPLQMPFAACHRLSQEDNAGIIVKFANLTHRNAWLGNAKNLRPQNQNSSAAEQQQITLSPDLPPVLKPLKADILNHRKNLSQEIKSKTVVRYNKTWPYITMKLPNGSYYEPQITLKDIVSKYYQPVQ